MRNMAAATSTDGVSRERKSGWMDGGTFVPAMDTPLLPKPLTYKSR